MNLQFKTTEDDLDYIVTGIRLLKLHVNNKFYSQSDVRLKNDLLIPNASQSHLHIDCTAAASDNLKILQQLAINANPIICKISFDEGYEINGVFFILNYSQDNSTDDIPEISFKLKSSGEYAINK